MGWMKLSNPINKTKMVETQSKRKKMILLCNLIELFRHWDHEFDREALPIYVLFFLITILHVLFFPRGFHDMNFIA